MTVTSANPAAPGEMIVTTTPGIEGRAITASSRARRSWGRTSSATSLPASATSSAAARPAMSRRFPRRGRWPLSEMRERATAVGGNAVVGVDLDYEVIHNMLMVSASGTAVTIE